MCPWLMATWGIVTRTKVKLEKKTSIIHYVHLVLHVIPGNSLLVISSLGTGSIYLCPNMRVDLVSASL